MLMNETRASSRAVSAVFRAAVGAFFWAELHSAALAANGDPDPDHPCGAVARPIIYGPGRQLLEDVVPAPEDFSEENADPADAVEVQLDAASPSASSSVSSFRSGPHSRPRPPLPLTGRQALDAYTETRSCQLLSSLTLQQLLPGRDGPDAAPRWTRVEDLDAPLQVAAVAPRPPRRGVQQVGAPPAQGQEEHQCRGFLRLTRRLFCKRRRLSVGYDMISMTPAGDQLGSYRILPVIRLVSAIAGTLEYEHVVAWEKGHEDERTASVAAVVRGYREAKKIPLSTRVDLSRQSDPSMAALPLSASLRAGDVLVLLKRERCFWGGSVAEHLDQVADMELGDDGSSLWGRLFGDAGGDAGATDEAAALRQLLRDGEAHLFEAAAPPDAAQEPNAASLLGRLLERSGWKSARTAELNRERYQHGHAFSPPDAMAYDTHAGAGAELDETLFCFPFSTIHTADEEGVGEGARHQPEPEERQCATMFRYDAEGLPTSSRAVDAVVPDLFASLGEIVQTQILRTQDHASTISDEQNKFALASVLTLVSTAKHLSPFFPSENPNQEIPAQLQRQGRARTLTETKNEKWRWARTEMRTSDGTNTRYYAFYGGGPRFVAEEMQEFFQENERYSFTSILNPSSASSRPSTSSRLWDTRRIAVMMTRPGFDTPAAAYLLKVTYGTFSPGDGDGHGPPRHGRSSGHYTEAPEITFAYRFDYQHEQHEEWVSGARHRLEEEGGQFARPGLPRVSGFALLIRPARADHIDPGTEPLGIRTGKPEVRIHWERAWTDEFYNHNEY